MTAPLDHHEPSLEVPTFPSAKLAMWLFLATEVMLFSGLLAGCFVLKAGATGGNANLWPTRDQTHIQPWVGTLNTVLLVMSSLCLSFALNALQKNNRQGAIRGLGLAFVLGTGFLGIKAIEYKDKFHHGLFPGNIAEAVNNDGAPNSSRTQILGLGQRVWLDRQRGQLEEYVANQSDQQGPDRAAAKAFLASLRDGKKTNGDYIRPLSPVEAAHEANRILGEHPALPVYPALPNGNLWASFYFTLTGIHATHLMAGLILIAICLFRVGAGCMPPDKLDFAENTALYWHFVDLVWLFLFPIIYLL